MVIYNLFYKTYTKHDEITSSIKENQRIMSNLIFPKFPYLDLTMTSADGKNDVIVIDRLKHCPCFMQNGYVDQEI